MRVHAAGRVGERRQGLGPGFGDGRGLIEKFAHALDRFFAHTAALPWDTCRY